jgi:MoxR-like ATPase
VTQETLPGEQIAWFAQQFDGIVSNIERVVQGKRDVIELVAMCMLSGGHVLIEDVPGVGKTLLAKSLARSIDCSFQRIQFTPDLLPSDITGVSVWDRQKSAFVFNPGPIFANIVVGDEINRASPKTQAALLEAMEEGQVTVDTATHLLDPPFMVIATQNPIEHEGTYPLPEAQLDRFMMRVVIGYPTREKELEILDTHGGRPVFDELRPVVHAEDVVRMVDMARSVHVAPSVKGYVVDLVEATRRHGELMLGASPRSALYLQRVARVRAAVRGREYVTPDDVKALASPVLEHRLALRPEAQMRGSDLGDIVASVVGSLAVPGTKTGT